MFFFAVSNLRQVWFRKRRPQKQQLVVPKPFFTWWALSCKGQAEEMEMSPLLPWHLTEGPKIPCSTKCSLASFLGLTCSSTPSGQGSLCSRSMLPCSRTSCACWTASTPLWAAVGRIMWPRDFLCMRWAAIGKSGGAAYLCVTLLY